MTNENNKTSSSFNSGDLYEMKSDSLFSPIYILDEDVSSLEQKLNDKEKKCRFYVSNPNGNKEKEEEVFSESLNHVAHLRARPPVNLFKFSYTHSSPAKLVHEEEKFPPNKLLIGLKKIKINDINNLIWFPIMTSFESNIVYVFFDPSKNMICIMGSRDFNTSCKIFTP